MPKIFLKMLIIFGLVQEPLPNITNIIKAVLETLNAISRVLLPYFELKFWGFNNPQFMFQKFKYDAWMKMQLSTNNILGLWQLTPTKQKSRPEIQA